MRPARLLRCDFGGNPASEAHISELGIAGAYFTDAGAPLTVIETSEFSNFKLWLDGDPRAAITLAERSALGFNVARVWLLNRSVVGRRHAPDQDPIDAGIHPDQYPDFYDLLAAYVEWVRAGFGMALELTAFTQCGALMPDPGAQRRHWERTAAAVRGSRTVLLEYVNEGDHPSAQNAPTADLGRPIGVLASHGSNSADAAPPSPSWDYALYHSNGLSEFQRKVGHNAMEYADQCGCPCVSNENTRYPDQDASPTHAYDAAAGAALLCAGSCFHSTPGKYGLPFDPVTRTCAEAWIAGARSIPLEFQRGAYSRHDERNGPACIRAYDKTLGDGRRYSLDIRP